jgi:hypothetical protein
MHPNVATTWLEDANTEIASRIGLPLREALEAAKDYVSFMKPTWLQIISESCAPDEDM